MCDNTDYEVFNELSEGLWIKTLKFKASITILLIFREGNFP